MLQSVAHVWVISCVYVGPLCVSPLAPHRPSPPPFLRFSNSFHSNEDGAKRCRIAPTVKVSTRGEGFPMITGILREFHSKATKLRPKNLATSF